MRLPVFCSTVEPSPDFFGVSWIVNTIENRSTDEHEIFIVFDLFLLHYQIYRTFFFCSIFEAAQASGLIVPLVVRPGRLDSFRKIRRSPCFRVLQLLPTTSTKLLSPVATQAFREVLKASPYEKARSRSTL